MFTAIKLALKSLSANPARTVLTTLGVVIGIATVVLVLSAGAGFRHLINSQVQAFGANTLFAETRVPPTTKNRDAGAFNADTSRAGSAIAITTLKNRDLDEIKRLPNVLNGYGMVAGQKVASYRDAAKNVIFYGASADRFEIDKGTLKQGRFFSKAEDAGAAQVAILGSKLAEDLFGADDPEGKMFRLNDLNFQVIGVYNRRGSLGGGEDDAIFIPLGTAQKKILGIDYLVAMIIELKDMNTGEATAEDARAILRRNHLITDPARDDFLVQTQTQALDTFNTIFNGITILLIAIAAISLIVGGVGIMNIMYVAVTERTAEIGLKKAVGAKPADISREFLTEAILITLLGGCLGIGLGAFLGWLVSLVAAVNQLDWEFSVPVYAMALAFAVAASLGISFGVLPARAAARLDPIQALRYE